MNISSDSVNHLIKECISDNVNSVLVIYDDTTENILQYFEEALTKCGMIYSVVKIDTAICHGQEPSLEVYDKMMLVQAVICLTEYSLAHTKARFDAEKKGIAFLSMPGYSAELIENAALLADYSAKKEQVNKYADMLTNATDIHVVTNLGTDLYLHVKERTGNSCPGLTDDQFLLGSPPDIEANIAPVENLTEGIIVIDGSVTDWRIGCVNDNVILRIEEGKIVSIESDDKQLAECIRQIFAEIEDEKAYYVGELGIGFNDLARLCGNMLVDEGTMGCIHFGMGSNWTIGGENKVGFHLDFVMKNATVYFDNIIVIKDGELLYE